MLRKILHNTILAAGLAVASPAAVATPLFLEDFNTYFGGIYNGGQYQSGLVVAYNGNVAGWSKTGGHAVHVVDHANFTNTSNPADYAVMIWEDTLTLVDPIFGANDAGQTYLLAFDLSAGVYQYGPQQTGATESVRIDVLRADGSLLASSLHAPGAWTGTMAFSSAGFTYTGDGTGDVRLRIGPSAGNQRFDGAIDNLALSALSVPEASTVSILALGLVCMGFARRRA